MSVSNYSRKIGTATLGLLLLAAAVARADWPEFRGPTGQGISDEKNLPIEWGPEKNIAWKAEIPGLGWSSPVLVDGKLYLTTAVPRGDGEKPDQSLRVICLDARTGDKVWEQEAFVQRGSAAPRIHDKNSHASPTPLVVNDRLYVHFGHMGTACYSLDGAQIWATRDLVYSPVHGNGGSPVYVDGLIVFTADGASQPIVAALEAETGELRWKYPRPAGSAKTFSFATPLVIEVKGQKQIIAPGAGSVSALEPKSGKEIWRVMYDGYSVIPRPVYSQGLVFMSTGYDSPVALAIRPDGKGDVTKTHVEWELRRSAPNTPSMLAIGDELYMVSDDGVASCLDAKSGKIHWQQRIGGKYSASPVLADGRIYFQSEEGQGVVIAPGKKFKKLGENGFPERTLASYAVGDGAIFVRTAEHLYRVEERGR
jgi:outer membrane protein assembly factor BamB